MTSNPLNIPHPPMGEHMTSQPSPIRSRRGSIQRMEKEADLVTASAFAAAASSSCPSSSSSSSILPFQYPSISSSSCYNLITSAAPSLMTGDTRGKPSEMTPSTMVSPMDQNLSFPHDHVNVLLPQDPLLQDNDPVQHHHYPSHEAKEAEETRKDLDLEEDEVMQFSHCLVNDLLKESITEIILHQDLNIVPPTLAIPPVLTPAWVSTSSLPHFPMDRHSGLVGGDETGSTSSSRTTSPNTRPTVSQRLAIKEAIREADARARRYVLDVRPASRGTGGSTTGTPKRPSGAELTSNSSRSPSEVGAIGRPFSSEAGSLSARGASPVPSISPPPSSFTPPGFTRSAKGPTTPVDPSYWARYDVTPSPPLPSKTPTSPRASTHSLQLLSGASTPPATRSRNASPLSSQILRQGSSATHADPIKAPATKTVISKPVVDGPVWVKRSSNSEDGGLSSSSQFSGPSRKKSQQGGWGRARKLENYPGLKVHPTRRISPCPSHTQREGEESIELVGRVSMINSLDHTHPSHTSSITPDIGFSPSHGKSRYLALLFLLGTSFYLHSH
ncbi:MAG: hypothetical protein DHS80DRAFT_22746 [Piptocephalis tieghemiana]|nr:MAG: hypothetical protein DHS80DRAFT_22746 [Piptocephalis tieghemiana]